MRIYKESQSTSLETGLAHRTFVCYWPTTHKDVPPAYANFYFYLICAQKLLISPL